MCSVALTLAFAGILFLSISTQFTNLNNLSYASLMSNAANFNPVWLKLSFLLLLIGYSAKMGLFPMHTVAVDAHTVAPPPVSAFISTTLMNVGFIAIFRIFTVVAPTSILPWAKHVLLISGVLSISVAVVYLLQIQHFKRMFAYSSLENMGLVAIGLGVGGIAYYAIFLHLIFHSFTKASMFYQIQQVHQIFKSYLIKHAGNYFKYNFWGALVMLLSFLCITAIPPSGMFVSEFMIFQAMFQNHLSIIAIITLILLTFAIGALGKNFLSLVYSPKELSENISLQKINPIHSLSQFILLGLVIYIGFNPPQKMVALIQMAIQNLAS